MALSRHRFGNAHFLMVAVATATLPIADCGFAQEQAAVVRVEARTGWTDAGIDVLPGDRLTLAAHGEWSNGGDAPTFTGPGGFGDVKLPDAELPTAPFAALIGRIGDDKFVVGRQYEAPVTSSGRLSLAMNDVHGTFSDNSGSVSVQILHVSHPVPMPDLAGQTFERASRVLEEHYGGSARRQDRYSHRPVGKVFSQTPGPGEDLRSAPEIVLDVSLGPQPAEPPPPVRVPDVIGEPRLDAILSLKAHGLASTFREYEPSRLTQDRVTRTDPPAPEEVADGTLIGFWLASGRNQVPPLVGKPVETAENILAEEGFSRGATTFRNDVTAIGHVLASDPPAGENAPLGTKVALTIGRDLLIMPNITGKSLEQARRKIAETDATLGIRVERKLRWERPDWVLSQSPALGAKLTANQIVTLGVSLPLGWIWAIAAGFLGTGATAARLLLWPPSIEPSLSPDIEAFELTALAESVPAISLEVELLFARIDSEISVPVAREE